MQRTITTGQRVDPSTGAITSVPADIGRLVTFASGGAFGVTVLFAGSGGISGRVISRGNLVSRVVSFGNISGVIAAQGDVGALERDAAGTPVVDSEGRLLRLGGIATTANFSGKLIALGNIFGDIDILGNVNGGKAVSGSPVPGLAANRDGILGRVLVAGSLPASGAIVSARMIGDDTDGTFLQINGSVKGIVAANGPINLSSSDSAKVKKAAVFYGGNLGAQNAAIVNVLFLSSFDSSPSDLQELNQMLANLAALHVGTDRNLSS